jgi:hypothetical protein
MTVGEEGSSLSFGIEVTAMVVGGVTAVVVLVGWSLPKLWVLRIVIVRTSADAARAIRRRDLLNNSALHRTICEGFP